MRLILIPITAVALAACATPQQRCMRPISDDLATVQSLIAETEAAIDRGYNYRTEPRNRVGVNLCTGWYGGARVYGGISYCTDSYPDYVRVPEAIDPAAERRKLAELRVREAKLQSALPNAQAACAARYP